MIWPWMRRLCIAVNCAAGDMLDAIKHCFLAVAQIIDDQNLPTSIRQFYASQCSQYCQLPES
jgi:hypothetical protein